MNQTDLPGFLGTVLHQYPDGILVLDNIQRIMLFNAAAARLFEAAGETLELGSHFPHPIEPESTSEIHVAKADGGRLVLRLTAATAFHAAQPVTVAAIKDITAEIQLREQLKNESLIDELTGLYNRKGFTSLAEHQLMLAQREQNFLSLVYFDLDGLKTINDTFGHPEGDHAINSFAALLKQSFRRSDILARLGGDEFAVLVVSNQASAAYCALFRLFNNFAQLNADCSKPYFLSASHGCAFYNPLLPESICELIASADAKMYLTKRSKKVIHFADSIYEPQQFPAAS